MHELGSLTEPSLAATLAGPAPTKATFADSEQSLCSVVLAALPEESADDATLRPGEFPLENGTRQLLLNVLTALEVSGDFLASGALVATVPALGSATDQAMLAARAAHSIKEHWPAAVVSLATGRGAIQGRTAVGEVVEQAARLLRGNSRQASSPAKTGVFLNDLSARLLGDRFVKTPQSDGVLLTGEEPSVDTSRPLLGKPTPCVGRDTEFAMLEAQLQGCIEESEARTVLITAPPGVGKSRLRHEFMRRVAARGESVRTLMGRGDMRGASIPFGLLRQALLEHCDVQLSDDAAARQEKLRVQLGQLLPVPERERTVPFLGELCGVPFPDELNVGLRAARQEPRLMEDEIRRSFVSWLRFECARQPVLLVLEDLHWSDSATVQLIDVALRELENSPLFVLALARPEAPDIFPKLWPGRAQPVPLRPLSRRASEQLVKQVLGKQTPAEVAERIVAQSAGNALFLEELIRAAAEGKGDEPPQTVLAMLQARIGRLELGARRILRAASVFGETCWAGGVGSVLAVDTAEAARWMQHLIQHELLEEKRECRFIGEAEYRFRHALMRDASYSLLSDEDRMLGHRLAAGFLERVGEAAAVLAYHYWEAGEYRPALRWYVQAGQSAVQFSQYSEARSHYAAASKALEQLPDTPEHRQTHVDVLIKQV